MFSKLNGGSKSLQEEITFQSKLQRFGTSIFAFWKHGTGFGFQLSGQYACMENITYATGYTFPQ